MSDGVKVEGLADLEAALADLGKSLGRAVLRRVGKAELEPMADRARAMAPDDPATSASIADTIIITTKRPAGQKAAGAVAFARARAAGLSAGEARAAARAAGTGDVDIFMGPNRDPKAVQQEFGNSLHVAQPYMRPAWDAQKSALPEAIGKALWTEIQKAAARKARRDAKRGG
ncbi:HK97 gp10 family phage protein [Haematobacter massiliensis]|uniref:HK97 gp10 family phage protein n=1 Tax=Haematobacter massiliensis TaxID=195105 RepID=UPI0023F284C6|nr:HK97 gp10 family phage protein [Haematobacter massiliensis]